MRLQLIRNATLRLTYAGHKLLIDPFFAPKHSLPTFGGFEPNPTVELPLSPQDILAGVELTIISHLHPDHFDPLAQELLPKTLPILCQSGDEASIRALGFEDVTPVDDHITWRGITVERTAGEHGSGEVLAQMGAVSGFVLRAKGEPTVYWAGDTVLYPQVLDTVARVQPDVIVTHSGGAALQGTTIIMDAKQTVTLFQAAPGATLVATHLEAVDHATVSRVALRRAAQEAGIASDRFRIPNDGDILVLS